MKKCAIALLLASIMLPVAATEFSIPNTQSVKSFSRQYPYDSRFQYSLPEGKTMSVFGRRNKEPQEHFSTNPYDSDDDDDDEDIVLDTKNIPTQKKVIKKLGPNYNKEETNVNDKNMPMNYDAFPKFYDPNDMMNQQFMPMVTY